ncbi:leucine-rich repeat domain-containing protein [Brevibacillus sp. SYSU BS000544]|uniref:leucine-rich repeat domain-containing protein n=1 Tax=Brevibacillus sp. SYSU BS000544 TaxID=3416443 RepID=UPI003CE52FEA
MLKRASVLFLAMLLVLTGMSNGVMNSTSAKQKKLVSLLASVNSIEIKDWDVGKVVVSAKYDNGDEEDVTKKVTWKSNKSSVATAIGGIIIPSKSGKAELEAKYKDQKVNIAVNVVSSDVISFRQAPWGGEYKFPLEVKIRGIVGKEVGDVTKSDVSSIKELTLNYIVDATDTDLEGLSALINLEKLEMDLARISDMSPIAKLTNLTSLNLINNNNIEDVTAVKNLKKLEYLNLGANKVTDITPVSYVTNLKKLDIYYNQITDISSLSKLKELDRLLANSNKITNISSLKQLTELKYLDLRENKIKDITAIKELSNLQSADFSSNQLSKLPSMSKLKSLTQLYLSDNKIVDISPLLEAPKLQSVSLRNNPLSSESMDVIKQLEVKGVQVHY